VGVLSSDAAVEMAAEGVSVGVESVGVEHHGGGETYLGVSSGDMALKTVVDGVLQWGWGWGCMYM
jgi:hypothetical protein